MFPPQDILVESSPSNTWFEQIGWAVLWTIFLAGVARIAFALFFESKNNVIEVDEVTTNQIKSGIPNNALPPSPGTPISDFGKWKVTDELFEPIIVKEKTSGELG